MATKSPAKSPAPKATLTAVDPMAMLAGAKSLPNKATTDKSGKKKKEITMVGIERLAMLDAVEKAAKGFKETTKQELEDQVIDEFLSGGFTGGKLPDSFDAIEGNARANVQMKRKASNIALNESEVQLLRDAGVEPHEDGIIPELFAFNPAHLTNQELIKRVMTAIAGVDGLPSDFIVKQDAKSRFVVTEDVAKNAWATGDLEVIRTVTTLAYAPKLEVVDAAAIGETMRSLFQAPDQTDAESLVKAKLAVEKARVTKAHDEKEVERADKFVSPVRKAKRVAAVEKA